MSFVLNDSWLFRLMVCSLGIAAIAGAPAKAESVVIKRKYDASKPHYSELKVDVVQKVAAAGMPGGAMEIKFTTLYGLREKVKESSGGKKTVTLTFERAMQSMDMPMMGNVEFDTDDPEDPEAAPMLAAIYQHFIGEAMTIEIGEDGKVIGFSGLDALSEKVSAKASVNQFWMMMKRIFTDKRGRNDWAEDPLLIYPNRSVKVGEQWEAESVDEDPQVGKLTSKHKYKLEKVATEEGRKVAHISYTSTISKAPDAESKDAADPEKPKTTVEGSSVGNAVYDIERGVVVRDTKEEKRKIVGPASAFGGGAGEMTVDIKIKSSSRIVPDAERASQKEKTARKIEERKKAEAEDDDDEDEDEDDDE